MESSGRGRSNRRLAAWKTGSVAIPYYSRYIVNNIEWSLRTLKYSFFRELCDSVERYGEDSLNSNAAHSSQFATISSSTIQPSMLMQPLHPEGMEGDRH
ncbi:hypothetical protein CEXT_684351 [Caerostris extrusa]|uniref:Maturase K n=1 Tax=Caerostris extrusa TaxID=172846 RepID=A0AAV4XAV7_CAEEX|nr:hypothetical protein CEXT_684351 [Caerostris extrusa]